MAGVDVPQTPTLEDFVATGRTGRRNAMADILDSNHASVSTADLPFDMDKLNCSDNANANDSTSKGQSGDTANGNS